VSGPKYIKFGQDMGLDRSSAFTKFFRVPSVTQFLNEGDSKVTTRAEN